MKDHPIFLKPWGGIRAQDWHDWKWQFKNGLAAPAGTPPAVIEALNKAAQVAVATAAVQDRLGRLGMRLQAGTPAELQALLGSEIKRWGEVIRAAKIEPE